MTSYIDKRLSLALKGIAVVMMVIGHCLGHQEYWVASSFSPFLEHISPLLRMLSRMSVGIFTFLAGYACNENQLCEKAFGVRLGSLKKLFIHYYFQAFLIFLPVALLAGGYVIDAQNMFYNITGLKDPLILFAWYVPFYATVIIALIPLMKLLLRGDPIRDLTFAVVMGAIIRGALYLVRDYSEYLFILCDWSGYYTVYMVGYVTAKHRLYEKVLEREYKHIPVLGTCYMARAIVAVVVLLCVLLIRYYIQGIKILSFESAYVFLFVYALTRLFTKKPLERLSNTRFGILPFLGKLSTDIWFIHALFFSTWTRDALQHLIEFIHGGVLKTAAILLFSITAAFIIYYVIDFLLKKKRKV